jgi:DNA-binding NarL/FixJ family response regulator
MGGPRLTQEQIVWWTLQFATGKTDPEIASSLGIRVDLAKSRAKQVIKTMGARNRNQHVAIMVETGLVDFNTWQKCFPKRKKAEPFYEDDVQVLTLLIEGYYDNSISERLDLSRRTLEHIRRRLAAHRGIPNRSGCLVADYLFARQGK